MTKTAETTITLSFSRKAMDLLEGMAKMNEEPSAKAYLLSAIRNVVTAHLDAFYDEYLDVDELFGDSEDEREAGS